MNVLSIGLFYLEYRDAIKEGDGIRILRCWKYLLKIFFSMHRTNYTAEALTLLMQHSYILTERQSAQLLYGQFINTEGIPGRNIPCDLHLEHLKKYANHAFVIWGQTSLQEISRLFPKVLVQLMQLSPKLIQRTKLLRI